MKSGFVVLVVGLVIALIGVGGWIYFIHFYLASAIPLYRAITYDVIGSIGVLWIVWKLTYWAVARAEGVSPSGKAVP